MHSLAMLITQSTNAPDDDQNTRESIPVISKSEMSREIDFETPVQRYQGPKIVPMPDNIITLKRVFFPSGFFAVPFFQKEEQKNLT